MKLRFYIQDFEISEASCEAERNEQAAAQANAKLERYIEKYGKVVYGHASIGSNVIIEGFHGIEHSDADHRAVLINIESLQAKCTQHKPKMDEWRNEVIIEDGYRICGHCNKKLVLNWTEAE